MIYFDHAASTPMRAKSLKVLKTSLEEDFANPSAGHRLGKSLMKKIEKSRNDIRDSLPLSGGLKYEFVFTGSATESNNMVAACLSSMKGLVLYDEVNHPSVTNSVLGFCSKAVSFAKDNLKSILKDLGKEEVVGLCLSHVDGQSGLVTPVEEMAKIVKNHFPKCWVHVDGVQAFGKVEFKFNSRLIDSYSISAHKIGGPKGVAGLFFSPLLKGLKPLLKGGGHEKGLRSSTPAAPLIYAFSEAVVEVFSNFHVESTQVLKVKNSLKESLISISGDISFPIEECEVSDYILLVKIKNVSTDIIMRHLEVKDIYVASSSACSSKIKGANSGYSAIGIPEQFHKNLLRISFSSSNTIEETKSFVSEIKLILEQINKITKRR